MSKIVMQDKEFLYENASIPVINKLQDNDVNNFKNAINQEGSFTSCNFGNSSYSCNLIGTLSTGDIIQVLLPLSNQNSSNDSDISISIDGGTTYYNLLDKTQEFNLKASDFEYNDIYLRAVFNGSNFVLISPDRVKNIMILRLASDYSLGTSLNYYNVSTLTSIYYQRGSRFSKGSITPTSQSSVLAGVKIGAGIKNIKFSFTTQATNDNNTSTMYFIMYGYRCLADGTPYTINRSCVYNVLAGQAQTMVTSETITPVTQNDIIGLRLYKSMSSGLASVNGESRTYLYVEEI